MVGGRYTLGMKPPDEDYVYTIEGVFHEVKPPEKLIYTWAWKGIEMTDMGGKETIVTVEFYDRDGSTEVVITHERFPSEQARDQHSFGWEGLLGRLEASLSE